MTRVQANLLLLVVALIWGSAFVAQSTAMAHVGPMTFTGLRFLIGAAVVLPWALREWRFLGARQLRPGRGDALQIAGLGGLLWLGAVMQQIGIIGTTVTNAGFLTALYVPLVPLLAWWWLGRRPHASVWPASVGCLVGTWMLSGAGQVQLQTGDLWVIASALPWAVHVLYVGRVADRMAAPFLLACGQFLVCGLVSLAWAVASESVSAAALGAAARDIAYTGIVSVGIGFTAQVIGQRNTAAADAAIILSSETVFAALFGYALMGDRLNALGWSGCALILACILLVQLLPMWRERVAAAAR
ncbi:MAG TPA: DMT family transporter [Burkholderiaceae bacterium]|nr:DMT family transporter [Burkholderiaceae bacterium]